MKMMKPQLSTAVLLFTLIYLLVVVMVVPSCSVNSTARNTTQPAQR